jgi:hypothetical protein
MAAGPPEAVSSPTTRSAIDVPLFNQATVSEEIPAHAARRPGTIGVLRPRLDELEPRVVMNVSAHIVNGQLLIADAPGNVADVVTLDHGGTTTVVNTLEKDFSFADAKITRGIVMDLGHGTRPDELDIIATVKPVTVNGNSNIDETLVGGFGNAIQQSVTLTNMTGLVDINDSQNQTTAKIVTVNVVNGVVTESGLTAAPVSFNENITDLDIQGGDVSNTFNIRNTPTLGDQFASTTIVTGTGRSSSPSTVNVLRTSQNDLEIEGDGGSLAVNVGNAGSTQGIQGSVQVTNDTGLTTLTVDDSADTVGRNVDMDTFAGGFYGVFGLSGSDTGFIESAVATTSSVLVKGGSGGNTFDIEGTLHGDPTTDVDTGSGDDQVFVQETDGPLFLNSLGGPATINIGSDGSLQGILYPIHIFNTPNFSTVNIDGSADDVNRTFILDTPPSLNGEGEIFSQDVGPIIYNPGDIQAINITGGQGDELWWVQQTVGGFPININGPGSEVNFIVGNLNNSLDDINNPLTLNGSAFGFDQLIVNDAGAATGHFYSNDGSQITRDFGAVTINYSLMTGGVQLNESPLTPQFLPDPFFPAATDLALTRSLRAGQQATLSGRLIDADPREVLSLTVNWGDGSAPVHSTPNRARFHLTHRYETPGTYKVFVTWRDSLGRHRSRHLTLTVQPAGHGKPHGHPESATTTRTSGASAMRSSSLSPSEHRFDLVQLRAVRRKQVHDDAHLGA